MKGRLQGYLRGLRHALTVINHPISGFYSIRYEGEGHLGACATLLIALIAAFVARRQYAGFLFNTNSIKEFNLLQQISAVLAPVLLWCVANWSITVLMDGEGRFRDIFFATCYATTPYTVTIFLSVLGSRFVTLEEATFLQLLTGIGVVYTALLLFTGLMTVHQFTVFRTIASIVLTLCGMAFIVFLALLFAGVLDQLLVYISGLVTEIQLRM